MKRLGCLLVFLCATSGLACDDEGQTGDNDESTGAGCIETPGDETISAAGACTCESIDVCLEGIENVAMVPSPGCFFEVETQMVVAFHNEFTHPPTGWQNCNAADAPEACGCCAPTVGCQASE